jgi:hypothetical protein
VTLSPTSVAAVRKMTGIERSASLSLSRRVDVEQDQVGRIVLGGEQRLSPAGDRPHLVAVLAEHALEQPQVLDGVVDHQDARRGRSLDHEGPRAASVAASSVS